MQRKPLVNNRIRAREVRVIDESGKQLGVLPLEKALQISRERNLDLIQVTNKVEPPVCKLMDYGKYLYQQKKKEKTQRHKAGEIKGIRLSFGISDHDLEIKTHQAKKFLEKGDKVRIELRLKGRQKALQGVATEKINKFLEILKGLTPVKIERELKRKPRGLTLIISRNLKRET